MKKFLFLTFSPFILFALERVNLIRNAGFELDDSTWIVEPWAIDEPNPAKWSTKDTLEMMSGNYSASVDTREDPGWNHVQKIDSVAIRQEFLFPKTFTDIDSLTWFQAIFSRPASAYQSYMCLVGITFGTPVERNGVCYGFVSPSYDPQVPGWIDITEEITDDSTWKEFAKSFQDDFPGIDQDEILVSFTLDGWASRWLGIFYGQKTYWDDIRLMGYADYNVALTRLTGTLGQPAAMVWNNGREDQTDVMVVAAIEGGEPYSDTIILPSLVSDDSTEVTFAEFGSITPSGNYYLTISTGGAVGMLDECDEDDVLTEEYLGVTEPVTPATPVTPVTPPDVLELVVLNAAGGVLRVVFKTPERQIGYLTLYDSSGRRIEEITVTHPGSVEFGSTLASGVYIVRLETPQGSLSQKAVVLN